MSGRLQGKVALITGGNSGIGLATAQLFQKEGAKVAISGSNESKLDEAQKLLGDEALCIAADVRSLPAIQAMMDQVKEKFGGLDVLFVNAGVGTKSAPVESVSEEAYDLVMDVDVKGAFFTMQKAIPILNDGGSIIVNASIVQYMGMAFTSVYCASKAAVRSFVRTASVELVGRNIRVNSVSPGPIATPFLERSGAEKEVVDMFVKKLEEMTPMNRLGRADEVAETVLFLASSASSYITGIDIVVDGGTVGRGPSGT